MKYLLNKHRLCLGTLIISILLLGFSPVILAQTNPINKQGTITEVKIEGLKLIEKGLIYSTIRSQPNLPLSPTMVAEDIKDIYKLGYFKDVSVDIDETEPHEFTLIFKLVEKPRILTINIEGHQLFSTETIRDKLQVHPNNMLNISKIKGDVRTILEEYRKKGYMQTRVDYEITKINDSAVTLTYKITEKPKVFLTEIHITGTKVYPPLDIERLMQSSEIDCFSWINDSGVFQESKINQDLQIITQHYFSNGFIKVKIDKPDVTLIQNPDYSKIIVNLHITEGDQYFAGKIDIESKDDNKLLFDKNEQIGKMSLKSGDVFNPFKQNADRYKINEIYQEQGYAFARIGVLNQIHDDTKTVDTVYTIVRGEKAYIGRIDIIGNYETQDHVVRRELEVHDNELFDGLKLKESQADIIRLGFFEQQGGVLFNRKTGDDQNTLDYDVKLKEAQTGSFNASVSYSGYSGLGFQLSVSKKNFLGTGRTLTVSAERTSQDETTNVLSITSPYWLDTRFTNSIQIFSKVTNEISYYVQRDGFDFGLTYPIWKYWYAFGNFNFTDEKYKKVTTLGEEYLRGQTSNTSRSLRLGAKYSTVNNPMFPTNGYEASFSTEQFGGPFTGTIEFRSYVFNTRYFKTLNESGTLVFGAKFNWTKNVKTNPDIDIPYHERFNIGGINTVRGFEWKEIEGPSSKGELGMTVADYMKEKYPYKGDYSSDCDADPVCSSLSKEKAADRIYFEQHRGGLEKRILNLQLYFPLTREGQNIRGLVFFDAGNVWSEDRMYEIAGLKKDDWYYRKSWGFGVNLISPMGVFRFEYGIKLDKKETESPSKFEFTISGLF